MINSKGGDSFMLKHIVGIILGIIGIIILFGISARLYGLFSGNNEKENAVNQLDKLIENLKSIKDEKGLEYSILLPKGWNLASYSKTSVGLPDECTGSNCICLCPSKLLSGIDCVEGICRITEKEVKIKEEIEIPSEIILKSNEIYEISKKDE